MGIAVGFVSGMFGIGGGFLMTPLLIFVGIAPAVAVASVASHIAASSFSGALTYWRRRAIDPALAGVLLCGGVACNGCDRHGRRDADEDQERCHQEAAADAEHPGHEADRDPHRQDEEDVDRKVRDREEDLHELESLSRRADP